MLATSDLPGGVVNLLTGFRKELVPTFATHTHLRAISAAWPTPRSAKTLAPRRGRQRQARAPARRGRADRLVRRHRAEPLRDPRLRWSSRRPGTRSAREEASREAGAAPPSSFRGLRADEARLGRRPLSGCLRLAEAEGRAPVAAAQAAVEIEERQERGQNYGLFLGKDLGTDRDPRLRGPRKVAGGAGPRKTLVAAHPGGRTGTAGPAPGGSHSGCRSRIGFDLWARAS